MRNPTKRICFLWLCLMLQDCVVASWIFQFRWCFQSDPVDFDRSSAALPERFAVSLRNHISYICSAYCLLVLNTPLPSCLLAFEWSHTGAQLSCEQCILGTPILDLFNGRASGEDPSHKLKSFYSLSEMYGLAPPSTKKKLRIVLF